MISKSYIKFVLVIFTCLIFTSCQSPAPPPDKNPQGGMKPTAEYNYLLDFKYWQNWADKTQGTAEQTGQSSELITGINEKLGLGTPTFEGTSDGENIIVTAKYPVKEGFEDKAQLIAKLPQDKMVLPGRIRSDSLVAYVKLPGLQSLVDTTKEYYNLLIQKNEGPSGQSNPVTQALGLVMMSGINVQEDLFSWMGPEMGLVSYLAKDESGSNYMNTAYAIQITDKAKAREKLNKIIGILGKLMKINDTSTLVTSSQYKTFDLDTLDLSKVSEAMAAEPELMFNLGDMKGAMLYTDDWLFISDDYGLKQLADVYDPGGAKTDPAGVAAFVDLDSLFKYGARYETDMVESVKKQYETSPELLTKFEDYYKRFKTMTEGRKFGTTKITSKLSDTMVEFRIETTKSTIEMMNFIDEWMTEMTKVSETPIQTNEQTPEAQPTDTKKPEEKSGDQKSGE